MKKIALFCLLSLFVACPALAQDDVPSHVHIRLVPERDRIEAGETILVAVEQTIEPGWHTYWRNPGDSGTAPVLTWTLPDSFSAGSIRWPVPEKIVTGPVIGYGYHDRAVLLQEITAPDTLPEGPVTLKADIEILACNEICVPEFGSYEITLNAKGAAADNADFINAAYEETAPMGDWAVKFRTDGDDLVLDLEQVRALIAKTLTAPDAAIDILPADWGVLDNAAPAAAIKTEWGVAVRQKRGDRDIRALDRIDGILSFGTPGMQRMVYAFEAVPDLNWKNAPPVSAAAKMPLFLAVLFAFCGGLILNLMPCVFPVLSLKALKLCKLSGAELSTARLHALLYMAGILVSFAVLAGLLVVLRGAGDQIGWGFQLQNPVFVTLLAWLLFVVGLNLSGVFEFGAGFANIGGRLAAGEGLLPSFFTGVLAAIVATPCTAPFMGAAMGYALTQSPPVTFAVFAALGVGLAFPYLLLSFVPPLRAALPKPGAWMEGFRQFLAFPMYLSAAWLVWVLVMQNGAAGVLLVLCGAVGIVFALWLAKRGLHILSALALLAVLASPFFTASGGDHESVVPYTEKAFAEAEAGNAPLFVNMTASWCITCKVNEYTTIESSAVKNLFAEKGVVYLRGDWTNRDPEITEFLARFGRNGVPVYVYYGPRVDGKRPDPVVLPQLLTPGIVENALNENK